MDTRTFIVINCIMCVPESFKFDVFRDKWYSKFGSFGQKFYFAQPYLRVGKVYSNALPISLCRI